MSLSIENEKVRVKDVDAATWYEFGLETIGGTVFHSDLVEVADPGDYDEAIVLSYGAEKFKVTAFTFQGRGFLQVDQDATEDAENGPVSLRVDGDGAALLLALVEGEDGRKYLNYTSAYIAALFSGKPGAKFWATKAGARFVR